MGHIDTISLKILFGPKLEQNRDSITAFPKSNIKNLVTYFINLELKMLGIVPFPPSNDGIGRDGFTLEQGCKKTLNETKENEKWCRKN
jgi:hypothetical protein